MHKLPNLLKDRFGTYYLRTYAQGRETRRSLRTKDWHQAKLIASLYHLGRAMDIRKFGLKLPNGLEFTDIKTEDEFEMVRRAIGTEKFNELMRSTGASPHSEGGHTNAPSVPKHRTKPLSQAVEVYLAQKALENTPKTLREKKSVYSEFGRLYGDLDMNGISAEMAISFKNKLIGDGLGPLRINKHLSFMKDLFAYATDHKLYSGANPFENLAIAKTSKVKQAIRHYEEFTDDELKAIFEDKRYKTFMDKPDYLWLPFLALYSGARIEELASLKVDNIRQDGGVYFFEIERGKTTNSIRKIPLHKNITASGFMDYLLSVKSQGGILFSTYQSWHKWL